MVKKLIHLLRRINFCRKTRNKNVPKILGPIIIENPNVVIGKSVTLFRNVKFWGNGKIEIGANVKIGDNTMIYASKEGGVTIGENTLIAANCYIIDMDHGISRDTLIKNSPDFVEKIVIGEDCWLGEDVTVVKGVILGNGCVVGAKSFLNKKFDSYKIIVGIPGRAIKDR